MGRLEGSESIELAKTLGARMVKMFLAKLKGFLWGKEVGARIGLTASVLTT